MPFQLSQGKKQSLGISPLGKSSQGLLLQHWKNTYKCFMLSDKMKLYYDRVARNLMIKCYILAGIFIIKLQYFTSTLSWNDGSHPLLWVIEKSSLRRKPCVFVSEQAENGPQCVGTVPVSAYLSLSLSFLQPPDPYVCECGEGLSWKLSVRRSLWGMNRNLMKSICIGW